MAKQRFINTEFWIDEFIETLEPLERYLFLYFLTNTYTSICGIYRLPMRQIVSDTKLTEEQVKEILQKFWHLTDKKKQKILYLDGWVYIKNFERHQVSRGSEMVKKGIAKAKKEVPEEILEKIKELSSVKQNLDRVSIPSQEKSTLDSDLDSDSDLDLDSDLPSTATSAAGGEEEKVEEKKKRKTLPHFSLIEYMFELRKWERNDIVARQYMKDASELLQACNGDVELAKEKIRKVKEWADPRKLDWGIGTVVKRWFELDEETATTPKKAYIEDCPAYQKGDDWYVINHDGRHLKYIGPLSAIQYA